MLQIIIMIFNIVLPLNLPRN